MDGEVVIKLEIQTDDDAGRSEGDTGIHIKEEEEQVTGCSVKEETSSQDIIKEETETEGEARLICIVVLCYA